MLLACLFCLLKIERNKDENEARSVSFIYCKYIFTTSGLWSVENDLITENYIFSNSTKVSEFL